MDELNEKKTAADAPKEEQTSQAPADYSRYMGTLNRIYRRGNNNPNTRHLQDGVNGQNKTQPASSDGKKDYSFLITLAVVLIVALIYWLVKNFLL